MYSTLTITPAKRRVAFMGDWRSSRACRLRIWCSALLMTLGGCSLQAQARSSPDSLGANLERVTDYSRSHPFADVMKQARGFGPVDRPYDVSVPVPVGPDGWPSTDFGILFFSDGRVDTGTYKLSFEGHADLEIVASSAMLKDVTRNAAANTTSADVVVTDRNSTLMLLFRNTGGNVKRIKLMRPGYKDETFTRVFLDHLLRFDSFRFMDWAQTNDSAVVHWSDRVALDAPTYTPRGVPWEVMIELANLLRKDVWINVPHQATDDYVTQLAMLFKTTLHPSLHVYVEYSNEVWNFLFGQAQWNLAAAKAEVAADNNSPLKFDGAKDDFAISVRRVAKRLKEISDIFRSVYGPGAFTTRVRPVLAGQMVVPATLEQGLLLVDRIYGPPSRYFWGVAGAPYFHVGTADSQTLSVDQLIGALSTAVDQLETTQQFDRNMAIATSSDLAFVAYEGGPDTFGPNNVAVKKAASMDPRMKDICVRYLNTWYSRGFGLFNWFIAGATNWDTPFGTWGLTDDMANQNTPKIQALDAVTAKAGKGTKAIKRNRDGALPMR